MKLVVVLGDGDWLKHAEIEVDKASKPFLSHIWQREKERLAIENRPDRNKAASSRGQHACLAV